MRLAEALLVFMQAPLCARPGDERGSARHGLRHPAHAVAGAAGARKWMQQARSLCRLSLCCLSSRCCVNA